MGAWEGGVSGVVGGLGGWADFFGHGGDGMVV